MRGERGCQVARPMEVRENGVAGLQRGAGRTLMRSPVVERQTIPMSGLFPIFSAVFAVSQASRGNMS
jgi:hypothetical protein